MANVYVRAWLGLFMWLTIRQIHELSLQYMQWQRRTGGVGFKLWFQTLVSNQA